MPASKLILNRPAKELESNQQVLSQQMLAPCPPVLNKARGRKRRESVFSCEWDQVVATNSSIMRLPCVGVRSCSTLKASLCFGGIYVDTAACSEWGPSMQGVVWSRFVAYLYGLED